MKFTLITILLAFLSSLFGCGYNIETEPRESAGKSGEIRKPIANDLTPPQAGKVGTSCQKGNADSDPEHLCLALKYVVYKDSSGEPLMTKSEVISNLKGINSIWKQCNISFQIEELLNVSPDKVDLQFHPSENSELTDIRERFVNKSTLLVVTTGSWDRSGSLGYTEANAWTSMPEDEPLGSILESPVATFSNIVAHELGHYLSLYHVDDSDDLMNPIIYDSSTSISEDQCAEARSAIHSYWQKMLR